MLGYTDGSTQSVSYLELADWISRFCINVDENLLQLWLRMVFSIAISNCDDHLRNHGFLLTPNGWTLSPAYDLNPLPYGTGLSLNINEYDNALDFSLPVEVAPYFGISKTFAEKNIDMIKQEISRWRFFAEQYGISHDEQERMNPAFRV